MIKIDKPELLHLTQTRCMLIFSNQQCFNNPQKPSLKVWLFFIKKKTKNCWEEGCSILTGFSRAGFSGRASSPVSLGHAHAVGTSSGVVWGIRNSSAKTGAVSSCLSHIMFFVLSVNHQRSFVMHLWCSYLYIQHSLLNKRWYTKCCSVW